MTESVTSGNVIATAKRHGIQAQQIYRWRERLEARPACGAFLAVAVASDPGPSSPTPLPASLLDDTSRDRDRSRPLVEDLRTLLGEQRVSLSRSATVAKPIDYRLRRWDRFASFLDDGRACLSNDAAERALRGFALGRKAWLFAGSSRGAERAAAMATLIQTAKLNHVDPQAWLADVLARIAEHPNHRLDDLLSWNWCLPLAPVIAA